MQPINTVKGDIEKMKRLYGYTDTDGEIYAADETWTLDKVELVPNPTWEQSDFTDSEGGNWIRVERLAALFDDLCKSTGMTKKSLATLCGVTASTFSRYCSGDVPVPVSIWMVVQMEARETRRRRSGM